MGYDRGDSFPFDFEPNGNPFGSKSKGMLSPRSYPIQFERKWKSSFFSARSYTLRRSLFSSDCCPIIYLKSSVLVLLHLTAIQ